MTEQPEIGLAAISLATASSYSTETPGKISGIVINRDRPLGSGYCGNDNCEHTTHKGMRRAQKAADTRSKKKAVA